MPDIVPENNIRHPGGPRGRPPERAAGRRVSTVAAHPFLVNRDAVAACFGRHRSILTHDAATWPDEQPGAYRGRFHRPELIRFAPLEVSLTGVGGPMLLARPGRRRLAGELVGGRTMPPRSPVAGHRCGSAPPGPVTHPTPTPSRRRVSPVGGYEEATAARRRHGPRAEAGDRAGAGDGVR